MQAYGDYIDALIQTKGLKKSFIAKKMGITPQGFSMILHNKRGLTISRADQLAEILGVSRSIILCPELSETLNKQTDDLLEAAHV